MQNGGGWWVIRICFLWKITHFSYQKPPQNLFDILVALESEEIFLPVSAKKELKVSSTPKPSLFTVIKKDYTDTTLCYVKKLFHKPWKLSHPGSNQLFQWHSRHFCGNRCLVLVVFYGVYVPWDSSPSRPTIWGICLFFPSHLKQIQVAFFSWMKPIIHSSDRSLVAIGRFQDTPAELRYGAPKGVKEMVGAGSVSQWGGKSSWCFENMYDN